MSLAPINQRLQMVVPAVAAGNDDSNIIGRAPFAGVVTAVSYAPDTAIVGADTNTRTISVRNRGQAGSGTTSVASRTLNAAGGTLPAFDESALTLSGTPANLVVAEGDILEFYSLHLASGLADPGGLVVVTIARS